MFRANNPAPQPQQDDHPLPEIITNRWEPSRLKTGDTRAAFFYLNDMHSVTEYMPFLKVASDQFDEKYSDITTFKVSGGDMKAGLGGTFNDITIDFLNSIGLELSALGNHELDCGVEAFARQLPEMNTKFVSSNIQVDSKSPLGWLYSPFEEFQVKDGKLKTRTNQPGGRLLNSCIVEKNGEKYGFIGLATPFNDQYRQKLEGVKFDNPLKVFGNIDAKASELKTLQDSLTPISDEDFEKKLSELEQNLREQREVQILIDAKKENLNNTEASALIENQSREIVTRQNRRNGLLKKLEPPSAYKIVEMLKLNEELKKLKLQNNLQKQIDELRAKGINKIILLSHLGTDRDRELIPRLDGVDIVIEGHDHKVTQEPIELKSKSGEPVLMVQAGRDGNLAGVLDVIFDSKGVITSSNNSLYRSSNGAFYEKSVFEIWKTYFKEPEQIATLKKSLTASSEKSTEGTLANLFAEAYLAMDHKKSRGQNPADFALMLKVGNLRKKGLNRNITDREIMTFDTWGDRIYKTQLTGDQVIQIINRGVKQLIPLQFNAQYFCD